MRYCEECKKEHQENAFCTACGKCLYKHRSQLEDNIHPFFQCECSQINYWD